MVDLVFTVPPDVQVPDGAASSTGTVLTREYIVNMYILYLFPMKFLWLPLISNNFYWPGVPFINLD